MTDPNAIAPRRLATALACVLIVAAVAAASGTAPGQSLQEKLDQTQSQLSHAQHHEGVLTSKISHESKQIADLELQVADLRNRIAAVAADLAQKQAELDQAQAQLETLRERLRLSIKILEQRLVAMYKSSAPDLITVLLQSHGFDDLLDRTEYLQQLDDQDNQIVARVRDLRNQTQQLVRTVKAARDTIAQRKAELDAARAKLETRTGELAAARKEQRATLADVHSRRKDLEGDLSDISEKIAEQLGSGAPLPAGPIRAGSSGLIWPVNGPVVSGFGMRWGRMHEGIDIAVPTGTPIRAAKSGTVRIAGSEGGYGNYTCVDHGGGLSTCYAHQEQILVSVGQQVAQAQVIGITDCTGHCFGPHVHFEVRINGQAVDPLGYL
jgi:murein DD-endopeptidase MepM/ murein hydrolase activator NlpD